MIFPFCATFHPPFPIPKNDLTTAERRPRPPHPRSPRQRRPGPCWRPPRRWLSERPPLRPSTRHRPLPADFGLPEPRLLRTIGLRRKESKGERIPGERMGKIWRSFQTAGCEKNQRVFRPILFKFWDSRLIQVLWMPSCWTNPDSILGWSST